MNELTREELTGQNLELLPDREAMGLFAIVVVKINIFALVVIKP